MSLDVKAKSPEQADSVARLIAGLFVVLGLGFLVGFLFNVATSQAIQDAETGNQTILAFLDSFGLIIPGLVIGGAIWFINIARKLFEKDLITSGWARQILFWIMTFSILGVATIFFNWVLNNTGDTSTVVDSSLNIPLILGLIVLGAICGAGWYWMQQNGDMYYEGEETIKSRESLLGWNLLLPTIVVLVIVAARPLERTFIGSLTDRVFAGNARTSFVGFTNYSELLGFRFDRVACEDVDGSTECATDEDGDVLFPNARRTLRDFDDNYRELRFVPVYEQQIGDMLYVFSARDDEFMVAVGNTLFFTFFAVIAELILGLGIALIVNSNFPGRGFMRAAMLVPWAIPTVVSAKLWEVMLRDNRSGVFNDMLMRAGIIEDPIAWLANSDFQIWSLIFVDVWKTTPFMALLILAGLQTIPSDIYEAADVDGAGPIRKFFGLTLPLLRPTIAVALVFRTLDSIRAFDVFEVLLGRQLQSMATYNQFVLVNNQEFGYASAIGVTIFIIILIFTIIYVRALGVETD